jgi:hypothetical protein
MSRSFSHSGQLGTAASSLTRFKLQYDVSPQYISAILEWKPASGQEAGIQSSAGSHKWKNTLSISRHRNQPSFREWFRNWTVPGFPENPGFTSGPPHDICLFDGLT